MKRNVNNFVEGVCAKLFHVGELFFPRWIGFGQSDNLTRSLPVFRSGSIQLTNGYGRVYIKVIWQRFNLVNQWL